MKLRIDLARAWEVSPRAVGLSISFLLISLVCVQLDWASIFDRFVAAERAPKSTAPPMKYRSFRKLAFNQERMLNAEGSAREQRGNNPKLAKRTNINFSYGQPNSLGIL